MHFQPSDYGKERYTRPGEQTGGSTVCRQPGVVYWPDVDPCVRPKSALYQDDAAWKKYQQTGYLKIKGGVYQPPVVADGDKSTVSADIETEESFWAKYQWYLIGGGVAAAIAGVWFLGRKRSS